ncbi:MAG: threonine synthase [Melioribacter sp.]|uniref:threonine synthase n=1 Tax=Rosettibacter primus TaxID=3111523 RepID=UPI00247D188D|nr:threonine synthase [Melioribacter sp.]
MKYYSTNNKNLIVNFETAVMHGLAEDGGLFMPAEFPKMEKDFIDSLEKFSFQEIAFRIAKKFIANEISDSNLQEIISNSITFPAPLVSIGKNLYVLELFHGPTLAFKDFGARFMAKTMGYFVAKRNINLNILVATSGDTGSAVAHGFYDTPGINVFILYPKGKVSLIQEKQLTTLDKNITALEINGTFDDCQRLVKTAFVDKELNKKLNLTSANSINIARLLPQAFYYFEAYKQIHNKKLHSIFSVPSGNLGNLTAGLIAKKIGLPISKFIGALNSNKVFAEYLQTGIFKPRPSIQTLSNAMDVGNPSNLIRIIEIYSNILKEMRNDIHTESYDDIQTRKGIKEVYENYKYIIDPHGSVGYLALRDYIKFDQQFNGVVLETAHPAKFKDVIEEELKIEVEIPERLAVCLNKEKRTVELSSQYDDLKEYLMKNR